MAPARSFRIVCLPGLEHRVEELLKGQGFDPAPETFHELARAVTREPLPLGHSAASFFGLIYIQDRSSMLPPAWLAPEPGQSVLDMCASPGGKTGFLSQLVGSEGFVLGLEPSTDRLALLRQNMKRLNLVGVATAKAESEKADLAPESFSRILLDPPCSGWGTADKLPEVLKLWTGNRLEPLVALQRALLKKAWEVLAPGGELMYSTCTTNADENEKQARWALDELGFELLPLCAPEGFILGRPTVSGVDGVLIVEGPSQWGQGFFLAKFRKTGQGRPWTADDPPSLPGDRVSRKKLKSIADVNWKGLPPGAVYDFGGKAMFLHQKALEAIPAGMRWQGHPLGRFSGDRFYPEPRCRALMPPPDKARVVLEEVSQVVDLVEGRAVKWTGAEGLTPVYYKELPLGFATAKKGRLVWSDRTGKSPGRKLGGPGGKRRKR